MSLAAHAVGRAAAPVDAGSSRGTLSQISPVDQHAEHLGRADAEHVGAERAAGRRMAVAADHEHAGPEMAALRQHDVADALRGRRSAAAPARRPSRA